MILCLVGFDIRFCLTNRISYKYVIFTSFITLETKLALCGHQSGGDPGGWATAESGAAEEPVIGGLSHIDSTRYIMHV